VAPGGARATSSLSALRDAIHAVLDAPDFTIVTAGFTGPAAAVPVNTVEIEKPDLVSVDATVDGTEHPDIIAIGSTRYTDTGSGWISQTYAGESSNLMDSALLYVDVLDRATAAQRHGDRYVVPPAAAVALLESTGLPEYRRPVGVALSATVKDGVLTTIVLRTAGPPPQTLTTTISRVGTSAAISPPPTSQEEPSQALPRQALARQA
jgi:hypothetical protein